MDDNTSARFAVCQDSILTQKQAQAIALAFISNLAQQASRRYVLLEDKIIEKPYAWVFPFNTKEYAETGDPRTMVLGTGPVVVNRHTRVALMAPPMPIQQYLALYESELNAPSISLPNAE